MRIFNSIREKQQINEAKARKKDIEEEGAPANVSGNVAGTTGDPPGPSKFSMLRRKKKKKDECEVNESGEYGDLLRNTIIDKGKKLGDWAGKSFFLHKGILWLVGSHAVVNKGPIEKAKKKLNKGLLKALKLDEALTGPTRMQVAKEYNKIKTNVSKLSQAKTHLEKKFNISKVRFHTVRGEVSLLDFKFNESLDEAVGADFTKLVQDGLKKIMDSKWLRQLQSANSGKALDNIILHTAKNEGKSDVKKTIAGVLKRFGKTHDEYMKISLAVESTKLDEKWKEGTYTLKDGETGKVLGKYKSGAAAQRAMNNLLKKADYENLSVELDEKWKKDVEIDSTGEHADKTVEQLKHEIEELRGEPGNNEEMSELLFALRAKGGWKKGEGAAGLKTEGAMRSIPISPDRRKQIEGGKLKVVHSIPSAKGSPTYAPGSHFQIFKKDEKAGQDPFVMATVSNPKKKPVKVLGYYGSHPSSTGALKFAKNGGLIESVELDEYRRKDVFVIVDKKGKVVVAELTQQNADKEISRHRGGTIVLDPDAKVGDVLKTFAKESVELDEADNTAAVAKQVKGAVKKYVTGTLRVRSKGGKTRFIQISADSIDNKLRKMMLDVMSPNAKVHDKDNISYGNISSTIISASVEKWVEALGLTESLELDEAPAKVWHLANKKFNLIFDKDGYTLVTQGSGKEKKLKAKTPEDATAELVKRGYRESVELDAVEIDEKIKSIFDIDPKSKEWKKAKHFKTGETLEIHPFDGARYVMKTDKGGMEFIRKSSVKLKESVEPNTRFNCKSFYVDSTTYNNFSKGRRKFSRWSSYVDTSEGIGAEMYAYVKKHPNRPIVIEDGKGNCRVVKFNRMGGGGNRRRRITTAINQELE